MTSIRTLARKHELDIKRFQRQLFNSDSSVWLASSKPVTIESARQNPGLGPIASSIDRHARLSFVGSVARQAIAYDDASLSGTVVTVSVAAHHRELGTRLCVDEHEAVTWLQLLLDEDRGAHLYTAGELSTTLDERNGTPERLTTRF